MTTQFALDLRLARRKASLTQREVAHLLALWDVAARRLEHRLTGHGDHIYAVCFTSDSQCAVTGSLDHDLRLWRVADGGEIAQMPGHGDKVTCLGPT
jgi:WD40 repeat protein